MKLRRLFWPALAALVVLGGAGIVYAVQNWEAERDDGVPTTRVTRGDLKLDVYATGELRAGRAVSLVAPPITGGSLRIVQLAPTGTTVKKGDVVIEFDPAEQQHALEQSRSELNEAEQEIVEDEGGRRGAGGRREGRAAHRAVRCEARGARRAGRRADQRGRSKEARAQPRGSEAAASRSSKRTPSRAPSRARRGSRRCRRSGTRRRSRWIAPRRRSRRSSCARRWMAWWR